MKTFVGYLKQVGTFFGFGKNSKYVRHYLDESNLRSGALMALVVIALEIWLIIRQHQKYIIPQVSGGRGYFDSLFENTSRFWLLMLVGVVMFIFCDFALRTHMNPKKRLIISLIICGLLLGYSAFGFKEPYRDWDPDKVKNIVWNVFLILLYALGALMAISMAIHSLYVYFKKRESDKLGMIVITFFALICLAFGMQVSFSDFGSTREPKMIICFLTMVLYVACLLVWKPYLSLLVLGGIFLGFYYLLGTLADQRAFFEGDQVNYLTFYISLVMVAIILYHQRYKDATKAEELEHKAIYDDLTPLHNYANFLMAVRDYIRGSDIQENERIYLFIDIDSFKSFNDMYGFYKGNELLITLSKLLVERFGDRFTARVSDDRFVAFARASTIDEDVNWLIETTKGLDSHIHPQLKFGAYYFRSKTEEPRRAIDKARYACSTVKGKGDKHYCVYDKKMHDEFHMRQYVTAHIEEAVTKGWIQPYYQPVVFSKGRHLCGAEALARWIDPVRGFLSPAQFIPVLEDTRMIHRLDACIFESVCRDIRRSLDEGLPVVPISINFSRLDFELMDAVDVFDTLVQRYNVPKELIHVEITESALTEEVGLLHDAAERLKEKGYALWLDDFGSGYSALNVLKDYEFDVVKIDMKFLGGFETNKKAAKLIAAIVGMSKALGMKTLAEGVETMEEAAFLEKTGCLRLQGYLYGKPMPREILLERIAKGELVVDLEEPA